MPESNVNRNVWLDISDEESRTYQWIKDGDDYTLTIEHPKRLMVSSDGSHRVDNGGPTCWYIKPTWDVLNWKGNFLF